MSPAAVLTVLVRANTAQANAALAATDAQLKKTAASGATMGTRVRAGMKAASVAALGVGLVAGKMAMDFDQAMTLVHTHAGASAEEIKNLRQPVLDLARASEFGPTALANALFRVESHGYRGARAMDVLRASVNLAQVGQSDLESTTYAVSAALNSGIKGSRNMGKNVGTLNAIVGQGSLRMEEMVLALNTGLLPAGRNFGLSLRQVGAALAVMTRAGVPAQLSATRLRMTFSLLAAPTDKAVEQFSKIGLSSNQLAKDMRKGPDGLITAIEDLHKHLEQLNPVQQAQLLSRAFGGGRSSSAIMTLVEHVGELGSVYDEIKKKNNEFGEAVRTQNETTAHKVKVAWSSIETDLVDMGAVFAPIMATLAHWVAVVVDAFSMLPGPIKTVLFLFALLAYPIMKITVLVRSFLVAIGLIEAVSAGATAGLAATGVASEVAAGQMVLFEASSAGAAAGMGLLATSLLAVGGVLVAGGLIYGFAKLMQSFQPDYVRDFDKASQQLAGDLPKLASAHDAVGDASKREASITAQLRDLQGQGLGNTKQAISLAHQQADAIYDVQIAQHDLNQAMSGVTGDIDDQRDAISGLRQQIQNLNQHTGVNRGGRGVAEAQTEDAKKKTQDLIRMVDHYRTSVINAHRASAGFAKAIPEQFDHVFGTFQKVFGKKWAIKIGMIKDPALATRIAQLGNQLNFITGGRAKKWVLRIIQDKKSDPSQKVGDLQQKLNKLSKKYGIDLKTTGLDKARSQVHDMQQVMNTVSTKEARQEYDKYSSKVSDSMRSAKTAATRGIQGIQRALQRPIALVGGDVSFGKNAPANQAGGFAGLVPGSGSGDKVLMQSLVEPGEGVFIMNRSAMGPLEAHNRAFPRRQGGGKLPPSLPTFTSTIPPGGLDETVAGGLNADSRALNPIYRQYLKPAQMAQAARALAGGPYKWGGGHSGFSGPYDCSGYVSAILHAGGLLGSPVTTDGLKGFGEPGPGKFVTVGVRGSTGRNAHTMMQIGKIFAESGGGHGAAIVGGWDGAFPIKRHPPGLRQGGMMKPINFLEPTRMPKEFFDPTSPYFVGWGLQGGGAISGYPKHGAHWVKNTHQMGTRWSPNESTTLLWQAGLSENDAATLDRVTPAESNRSARAINASSRAAGLYQILGSVFPGNLMDPRINAINAAIKFRDGGLAPWEGAPSGPFGHVVRSWVQSIKTGKGKGTKKKGKADPLTALGIPAALVNEVNSLSAQSDLYADFADRADQIGGDVFGHDEVFWLNEELKVLFKLRNRLVKIIQAVNQVQATIAKQVAQMQKALKEAKRALRGAGKNGKDSAQKRVDKISNSLDKATQHSEDLGSAKDDYISQLEDIQGQMANPMIQLDTLPTVGELGGRIFDVQMSLNDASGADGAGAADTGGSVLSAEDLKNIKYLSDLGVKFNPGQFAGMFALGGYLRPGMWGMAGERGPEPVFGGKAGATVFPTDPSGGGATRVEVVVRDERILVYQDGELIEEIAHDVYDKRDRTKSNRFRQRMG